MLRMTAIELSRQAGVAPYTITRLEAGKALMPRTLKAIEEALQRAGCEFVNDGVRIDRLGARR